MENGKYKLIKSFNINDNTEEKEEIKTSNNEIDLINRKKNIIKKSEILDENQYYGLLNLIKNNDIEYSSNKLNTFVNLSHISDSNFYIIENYIDECNKYQKNLINNSMKTLLEDKIEFTENLNNNNNKSLFFKKFNEIKNNKKLNSLEKSVIRNNINKQIEDEQEKNNNNEKEETTKKSNKSNKKFFVKSNKKK